MNKISLTTLNGLTLYKLHLVLYVVAFAIPFLLNSNQLLTGTLVNALFFLGAYYLPKKYYLPLIVLPSLSVLTRGALFGPFTLFLVYFLPFIWMGNFLLILVFKKTYYTSGIIAAIIFSACTKQALLLFSARFYYSLKLVPALFLNSMGVLQLLTALLGGLIFYFIIKKISHEQS